MTITYMTEEGLRKLKEELVHLESVQRPEICVRLLKPATRAIIGKR